MRFALALLAVLLPVTALAQTRGTPTFTTLTTTGLATLGSLSVSGTASFSSQAITGTTTYSNLGTVISSVKVLMEPQGALAVSNVNREFQFQGVNAGDRVRLVVGGVGEGMSIDAFLNLGVAGFTNRQGATNAILIPNGTCATAAPTGGGVICVEAGALRYRGSAGTLTTLAPQ